MFRRIIKMLKAIKKIYPSYTFKIAGISGSPQDKNIKIIYQVSGKATSATEKPNALIQELMYLKGFSKQDADLIFHLATAEKLSYSFKILSLHFEHDSTKFEVEDIYRKHTLLLTASEIVNSNKILDGLSPRDITKIYFQFINETKPQHKISHQFKLENKSSIYLLKSIGANE